MSIKSNILKELEKNKDKLISGSKLAKNLNVSRTSIWKYIEELREEGYEIKAIPNKGYSLSSKNDLISAEGISNYLKENHIKTALATSTQRERVEIYFEKGNLPLQFDATVCGREVKNGKPAPDVFLKAAELLGLEPGECLVIEDSYNGIRAANAAGCQVVMVPDMDEPTEETKAVCAQTLESLYDVIRYLDELKKLS